MFVDVTVKNEKMRDSVDANQEHWIGGIIGVVALIASTRPLVGKGYLYPLIPFNGRDLRSLLHRRPISRDNT